VRLRLSLGLVLLTGTTTGCLGGVGIEAPPPMPRPTVEIPSVELSDVDAGVVLMPPPESDLDNDPILQSPMWRDPDFREEVDRWIDEWTQASWFPDYLERMRWFEGSVDSVLASQGLPISLRYLPLVESGYSPRAVSRVSAVGLWQFMEPTARGLGIKVSPLLDERRNPFRSTEAAATFLAALHQRFGSWFLALAAYNAGPARIQRVLDLHAPLAPRTDSLYWALRSRFPRETREFVPKFFGAVMVAVNPTRYGLEVPDSTEGFSFDRVSVPDATTLDVVAKAAGVDQREIERLNPEVVRGITPPGKKTYLRVPVGRGQAFTTNYAKIPPKRRVTFVEHRVRKGETLTGIARRYGIRLRDLEAANPGVRPQLLQIGQRLIVPIAPRAGERASR